ncbi:MAG: 3-hydroxyacyl-CoA dehydrogenase NAD-binding domain-containing protein, partial [Anaerolineaceae bacterium]|nr:3-hydroxyacyl-CoA dehydrogenase NAD-binding domain-containing protein [Anaerolineaceae bacterium]
MSLPEIKNITIIGAGTMGHSIGGEFALAGYDVLLHDLSESILQDALAKVTRNLKEMASWSLIDEDQIQPTLDRIKLSASIE